MMNKWDNNLKTISDALINGIDIIKGKESINVFSYFVSSNSSYKYNKTYLEDLSEKYFNTINMLQCKKSIVDYIKINEKYSESDIFYILIDHFFIIKNNSSTTIVQELERNTKMSDELKENLNDELKLFNLAFVSNKELVIKYYENDSCKFVEKIKVNCEKVNDESEKINKYINNLVEKQLKMEKDKNYGD